MAYKEMPQRKSGSSRRSNITIGEELDIRRKEFEDFKNEVRNSLTEIKEMIREQNEEIIKIMAEHVVYLKQLQNRDFTENQAQLCSPISDEQCIQQMDIMYNKYEVSLFPISNEDDLRKIEMDIIHNEYEIVESLKKILLIGGIKKNLHKILAKDIILNYNYHGVKGKFAFKQFTNLNSALFKACSTVGYSKKDYILDLKHGFKLFKNRIHKAEFFKRKANNSAN